MLNENSISNMLHSIIPISRFNKGEANKIFEEVAQSGYKIVVKNNKPTCVLLTPDNYQQLMEIVDEHYLLLEAEKRMQNAKESDFISSENVMRSLNITEDDIAKAEVEIE